MKTRTLLLGLLLTSSMAGIGLAASPARPDLLQFSVAERLVAAGSNSLVKGVVDLNQNQVGAADNQRFGLLLTGLGPNATYRLLISTVNNPTPVEADTFVSGPRGNALVRYTRTSPGRWTRGTEPLPDALNPLAAVRSVIIADEIGNVIAEADLSDPAFALYLVSRRLTPFIGGGGIETINPPGVPELAEPAGVLRLMATSRGGRLSVCAGGLIPNAAITLAVNDGPIQTVTSDSHGNVQFVDRSLTTAEALAIRSVSVGYAAGPIVLETTLP